MKTFDTGRGWNVYTLMFLVGKTVYFVLFCPANLIILKTSIVIT